MENLLKNNKNNSNLKIIYVENKQKATIYLHNFITSMKKHCSTGGIVHTTQVIIFNIYPV